MDKKYCNVDPKIMEGAYRLSVQNKRFGFIFLEKLYKNANIYLDRKYQNYLSHIDCAVPEENHELLIILSGIKQKAKYNIIIIYA